MIVMLLTEHHLECPGLKRGCRGSSESTLVKMSHCWKFHALAHFPMMFVCLQEKLKEGYAKANTEMQLWEGYLTVSLTLYVLMDSSF